MIGNCYPKPHTNTPTELEWRTRKEQSTWWYGEASVPLENTSYLREEWSEDKFQCLPKHTQRLGFALDTWKFWQHNVDLHARRRHKSYIKSVPRLVQGKLQGSDNKRTMACSFPDWNPMDYSIWGLMGKKLKGKRFRSITGLKYTLKRIWNEITTEELAKIVDNFPKRLRQCIEMDILKIESYFWGLFYDNWFLIQ